MTPGAGKGVGRVGLGEEVKSDLTGEGIAWLERTELWWLAGDD